MELLKIFRHQKECKHSKVSPQEDFCYCPDCGELIENRWYITRCKCCGVKIKASYKNGQVISSEKFCHNCGGKEFEAEQIPKINCIDINYAILVKTVINTNIEDFTQSWAENSTQSTIKLLTQT